MLDRSPQLRTPVPLGRLPDVARGTFRRLVLISRRDHLDGLGEPGDDTLLVSSSWLLWQELVIDGWPCVHIESALSTEDPDDLARDIYLRANDWIYVDGRDATEFRGVSLGRKLVREVSLLILERERLFHSLTKLVETVEPKEIVVFDIRGETSLLDAQDRLAVARDVADSFGIALQDRIDPSGDEDPYMPIKPFYGTSEPDRDGSGLARWAKTASYRLISAAGALRQLFGDRRPGVLIMATHLSSRALLERCAGRRAVPVVPIDWLPNKKSIRFLIQCILRGVRIPYNAKTRLSPADVSSVEKIRHCLEDAWQSPDAGPPDYVRRYVKQQILDPGRLLDVAEERNRAATLLSGNKVRCLFTDGLQNNAINTALEVAHAGGVETAASWHGPFIQNYKLDILGCDPRYDRVVGHCLTWGAVHEGWLAGIGSDARISRTGNLALAAAAAAETGQGRRGQNALILQYAVPHADFIWPQAGQYAYFVNVARAYSNAGYRKVRLKLHPGPSKIDYYRRIADLFGIDCEIYSGGAFMDHVAWADSVTGPVHSGAMLEVMRAGKPYFPVLMTPHSIETDYLDASVLHDDDAALYDAIAAAIDPDPEKTLEDFASCSSIASPASEAWTALERIAAAEAHGRA